MTQGNRVPDWVLERVALGEIPAAREAAIEARCAADPSASERLEALAEDSETFLAAHPVDRVVAEIERRARTARAAREQHAATRRRSRRAWGYGIAAVAVAGSALAALVLWPSGGGDAARVATGNGAHARGASGFDPRAALPPGDTRVKGGPPHLLVHRKRGDHSESLARGARVAEGDRIQLSYVAATARYGVILSIDGRGVVTVHFPAEPGASTALRQAGAVHLTHSYQLDDAPEFERFFFVTSQSPIDVEEVRRAAETLTEDPKHLRTADLPLGEGLEQSVFLLRKDSRQ